jgi:hypothetical protein
MRRQISALSAIADMERALSGLGLMLQDIGDDRQALEVYASALAVYPRLPRIPELVKTLQEKVEGRYIEPTSNPPSS